MDRLGADIGLRCRTCNRHVLIDRRTVERRLAGFVSRGDAELSAAVGPQATLMQGTAKPPRSPGGETS